MALLVDTGVLYALADRSDAWHERAVAWLDTERDLLSVPVTVLVEAAYLLAARLGPSAEQALLESIASGELAMERLTADDLVRVGELLRRYPEIGFVDASVVAMAERLGTSRLATTDRRHFGRIRPTHVRAFALVP